MSADVGEILLIPKTALCRRCNNTGEHLRQDGMVECTAVNAPVPIVQRSEYSRYELCPNRAETIVSSGLKLLAKYARKLRSCGSPHYEEKVTAARERIRQDQLASRRVR